MKRPRRLADLPLTLAQWEAIRASLLSLLDGDIASPYLGICGNMGSPFLHTCNAMWIACFDITRITGATWPLSRHRGERRDYPVPEHIGYSIWEGPNRELRFDLMKHMLKKIDQRIERMKKVRSSNPATQGESNYENQ